MKALGGKFKGTNRQNKVRISAPDKTPQGALLPSICFLNRYFVQGDLGAKGAANVLKYRSCVITLRSKLFGERGLLEVVYFLLQARNCTIDWVRRFVMNHGETRRVQVSSCMNLLQSRKVAPVNIAV